MVEAVELGLEKWTGLSCGGPEERRNRPGTEMLLRSHGTYTALFLTTTPFKISKGKKRIRSVEVVGW